MPARKIHAGGIPQTTKPYSLPPSFCYAKIHLPHQREASVRRMLASAGSTINVSGEGKPSPYIALFFLVIIKRIIIQFFEIQKFR